MDKIESFFAGSEIAVIGSFKNSQKPAFRIVELLLEHAFKVYPVNPHTKELLKLEVYPSIQELPQSVEAVVLVTPPEVSLKLIQALIARGIKKFWLQPGAEDEKLINFIQENQIPLIYGTCIMLNPRLAQH